MARGPREGQWAEERTGSAAKGVRARSASKGRWDRREDEMVGQRGTGISELGWVGGQEFGEVTLAQRGGSLRGGGQERVGVGLFRPYRRESLRL